MKDTTARTIGVGGLVLVILGFVVMALSGGAALILAAGAGAIVAGISCDLFVSGALLNDIRPPVLDSRSDLPAHHRADLAIPNPSNPNRAGNVAALISGELSVDEFLDREDPITIKLNALGAHAADAEAAAREVAKRRDKEQAIEYWMGKGVSYERAHLLVTGERPATRRVHVFAGSLAEAMNTAERIHSGWYSIRSSGRGPTYTVWMSRR